MILARHTNVLLHDPRSCVQINMLPYLQWSVSHPHDSRDPTVSPVPSSVNGTVQLLVYNNAGYAITVRAAVLSEACRA